MKYTIQIAKCDEQTWAFLQETVGPRLAGHEASIQRAAVVSRNAPATATFPVTIQINDGDEALSSWLEGVLKPRLARNEATFIGDSVGAIPGATPRSEDTQPLRAQVPRVRL